MTRPPDITPLKINTDKIELFDISEIKTSNLGVWIKSPYYTCDIFIGAIFLQYLINWCISNHYITVDGTVTIPVGTLRRIYHANKQEKAIETTSSTGIPAFNESS